MFREYGTTSKMQLKLLALQFFPSRNKEKKIETWFGVSFMSYHKKLYMVKKKH